MTSSLTVNVTLLIWSVALLIHPAYIKGNCPFLCVIIVSSVDHDPDLSFVPGLSPTLSLGLSAWYL